MSEYWTGIGLEKLWTISDLDVDSLEPNYHYVFSLLRQKMDL
jgi:hypothetical protein